METITFYSYKGGVGRTLALANVAHYLALLGKKVVAVDFDLEAPGLHYKLIQNIGDRGDIKHGLVNYISDTLAGKKITELDKYTLNVLLPYGGGGSLHVIPAGSAPSPSYWETLASIDWQDMLYGGSARGALIFLELKALIQAELMPDFLLIDARTGITEIGGVATAIMADKIVCMLTTNPENLEGARVVLRGMTHAPRPKDTADIQVFPVISRLHTPESEEDELIAKTLEYLNEPAEDLASTLSFSQITVLHNDDDILSQEKILVGGDESISESLLLRDYLSLFARLSADTIKESTAPIIRRAMAKLLERPDEAQQEIENLAFSFNAPEAFRELLKIYRLRNVRNDKAILTAQRLWYFKYEEDLDLVVETIQSSFKEIYPWASQDREYSLDFIEDIWRRAGPISAKLSIDLAESLDNFSEKHKSAEVIRQAFLQFPKNDSVMIALLRQLGRIEEYKEIRSVVESNIDRVISNEEMLLIWAGIESKSDNPDVPEALLSDNVIATITSKASPYVLIKILTMSGRQEELKDKAADLLRSACVNGNSEDIFIAAKLLVSLGKRRELSDVLSSHYDTSIARRIEGAAVEDDEYAMPNVYDLEVRSRSSMRYK